MTLLSGFFWTCRHVGLAVKLLNMYISCNVAERCLLMVVFPK